MEGYLFLALAGMGYVANKLRGGGKSPQQQQQQQKTAALIHSAASDLDRALRNETQSAQDVYDSRYLEAVRADEVNRATAAAHLALNGVSGVVDRNERVYSTSRYLQDRRPRRQEVTTVHSSLSGLDLPVERFTHNNMVPFYRGSVKQNTDGGAYQSRMEAFTGADSMLEYGKKTERAPLFRPQTQNVFGPSADQVRDAFLQAIPKPRNMAHAQPAPELVGRPGVVGGSYMDTRSQVLPKSVDDLRVLSRPKVTHEARIVSGLKTTADRFEPAEVQRMRPSLVTERTAEDLVPTAGPVAAQRARPAYVDVRDTARQQTSRAYVGAAAAASFLQAPMDRGAVARPTLRTSLQGPQAGPATAAAGGGKVTDYGKSSILVYTNERDTTLTRTYQSGITTAVKALIAPIQDMVRQPRKNDDAFVNSAREFGNAQGGPKMTVYDSDDVARTTLKQVNLSEAQRVNLAGHKLLTIYDPEDVARTTMKQSLLSEAPSANMWSQRVSGPSYDPDAVARTTLKESTLSEATAANLRSQTFRLTVYDPEDVARTTAKEAGIHDASDLGVVHAGVRRVQAYFDQDARVTTRQTTMDADTALNPSGGRAVGPTYDPEAWRPGVTTKQVATESLMHVNGEAGSVGSLQGRRGGAYATSDYTAEATHKQFLVDSGTNYGLASTNAAGGGSGYQTAPEDLRDTLRQVTTDTDYYGPGLSDKKVQRSYAAEANMSVNTVRDVLSQGREPMGSSTKVAAGQAEMGASQRVADRAIFDMMLAQRDVSPTRIMVGSVGGGEGPVGEITRDGPGGVQESTLRLDRFQDEVDAANAQLADNPFALPAPGGDHSA